MKHFTPELIINGGSLGQLIHFANNCKDKLLDQCASNHGCDISATQFKLLIQIRFRHITNPAKLSQTLMVDSGAITRLIDRLEQKGILCRKRCTKDRRQVIIQLTKKGMKLTDQIPQIAADAMNQFTCALTEAEIQLLEKLLEKILISNDYIDGAY